MSNYPCKNCPDRYPACHDHCEKYKEAKVLDQKRRNIDRGNKDAYVYTMERMAQNSDFNRKKRSGGRLTYSKKG